MRPISAPKAEKFPTQFVSLKAIRIDRALQSRVKMSADDMREFAEAMRRGDTFPPVTLFFDEKVHWLADGFHRCEAAKQAQLGSILAEIRSGTYRDAMIFSAGANQKFSIRRTIQDIQKAIWMLLEDEEWRNYSTKIISDHVGHGLAATKVYVSKFYELHPQIKRPTDVIGLPRQGATSFRYPRVVNAAAIATRKRKLNQDRPSGGGELGLAKADTEFDKIVTPHSNLSRSEAIAECRRIGNSSQGNGWKRLLWRMADLLEATSDKNETV